MLIYLAAPYSEIENKEFLMERFLTFAGKYLSNNPNDQIVSPLYNHFSLKYVKDLGSDWNFWKNYSEALLLKCDMLVVLCFEGWENSIGVEAEVNFAQEHSIPINLISHDEFTITYIT